jgi:putative DNA primase/helicase
MTMARTDQRAIHLARAQYRDDIRDGLHENLAELFAHLTGKVGKRVNKGELRFGNAGSLSVVTAGRKRGLWSDHENGSEGGDVFAAIKHYAGISKFADQIDWAARWLNVPAFDPTIAIKIDPSVIEARIAERKQAEEEHRRIAEAEQAKHDAIAIADAQAIWARCIPLAGTVGEVYLAITRAIGVQSWPNDAIRFDPIDHAVTFNFTDDAGRTVAVQGVGVTATGEKDLSHYWTHSSGLKMGPRAKNTTGRVGLGSCKLPGRIPGYCVYAEGPESGATPWALGYTTAVAGGSRLLNPVSGVVNVYARDDDDLRAFVEGETEKQRTDRTRRRNAERDRQRLMRQWRLDGYEIVQVYPFSPRRYGKGDLNDLAKEQGLRAVRSRINSIVNPALPVGDYVSIKEGRRKLGEIIQDAIGKFSAWDPGSGDPAPVMGVGATVGVGKSHAVRQSIMPLIDGVDPVADEIVAMRDRGEGGVFVFASPYHRLNDEFVEKIEEISGGRIKCMVYRGRGSMKPGATDPKDLMCVRYEDVKKATSLRVNVGEEICPTCPLRDECAYMAQRGPMADADIVLLAHAMLYADVPSAISKRGVKGLIIDETFWQSNALIQGVEIAIDNLEAGAMPVPPDRGVHDDMGGSHLSELRDKLRHIAIEARDGPLMRKQLQDAGFCYDVADAAEKMEWKRLRVDGPWQEREENKTIGAMSMAWRGIRDMFEDGYPASGHVRVAKNKDGARVLRLSGRQSIGKGWAVPTLLIDAAFEPKILRYFWPDLVDLGRVPVDAPNMRVTQYLGSEFSIKSLVGRKPKKLSKAEAESMTEVELRDRAASMAKDQEPVLRRRREVASFIMAMARKNGGKTVAIGYKDAIHSMGLPAHVQTAHFGALSGLDKFGDCRTLIVVGRPQTGTETVEGLASALTGMVTPSVGGWYPRRDVMRVRRDGDDLVPVPGEAFGHTDPMAELIRWRICEGEIEQAIGRCRGVSRKAVSDPGRYNGPVEVIILSDVVLSTPVDEFRHFSELEGQSPIDRMLAEGGIAFENGATACAAYPGLWPTAGAARLAILRSTQGPEECYKPHIDILVGNVTLLAFQRDGAGNKPQRAIVDPAWHSDPRAAVEATIGPVVWKDAPSGDPISLPTAVGFDLIGDRSPVPAPPVSHPVPTDDRVAIDQPVAGELAATAPDDPADQIPGPIQPASPEPIIIPAEATIDPSPPGIIPAAEYPIEVGPAVLVSKRASECDIPLEVWDAVFERAHDAGVSIGEVAKQWCGVSLPHLSNMRAHRRGGTWKVLSGLRAFLMWADSGGAAHTQMRLF